MKLTSRARTLRTLSAAIFVVGIASSACGSGDDDGDTRDWTSGSDGGDPSDPDAGSAGGGDGGGGHPGDPSCVPTDCIVLGPGKHDDDGCGSPVDCGAAPCTDTKEGNDSMQAASDIGAMSDNPDSTRLYTDLTLSDADVDWFSAQVTDSGFGGNPVITATTSSALEILIVYSCTSKPDYSTCASGTADTSMGTGCIGTTTVVLNTECSGIDESGTAYIRVRKKTPTNACTLYTLHVDVK